MDTLSVLYVAASVLAAASYIPQIVALARDRTNSQSVALTSWCMGLTAAGINLAYFTLHVQDKLAMIACTVGLTGTSAVLMLLIFNRFLKEADTSLASRFQRQARQAMQAPAPRVVHIRQDPRIQAARLRRSRQTARKMRPQMA